MCTCLERFGCWTPDSISALEQNRRPLGELDTGECSSSAGEAGWKQKPKTSEYLYTVG